MRTFKHPLALARFALVPMILAGGCSREPAPSEPVTEATLEQEEPEETQPERMPRAAQERGPLVANLTMANVQSAFAGLSPQREPLSARTPTTAEDVLASYRDMAEYRGGNPRASLVGDLASLERRSASVNRELQRLTRERSHVKATSGRARVLDREITRFESELSSRRSQASLLRNALTQSN